MVLAKAKLAPTKRAPLCFGLGHWQYNHQNAKRKDSAREPRFAFGRCDRRWRTRGAAVNESLNVHQHGAPGVQTNRTNVAWLSSKNPGCRAHHTSMERQPPNTTRLEWDAALRLVLLCSRHGNLRTLNLRDTNKW